MNRTCLPLACGVAFALCGPVLAEPDCEDWNTAAFFEVAIARDIDRCLKAGADLNARGEKYGGTPLHWAAQFGTGETVNALLNSGANFNVRDEGGLTPLQWAAQGDLLETLNALLNAGANPNVRSGKGFTPLHGAAVRGTTEMIAALLKAGADLNVRTEHGATPLHLAALNGTEETVNALLDAGADAKARTTDFLNLNIGKTPFDLAKDNEKLQNTDAYWRLNEARFK